MKIRSAIIWSGVILAGTFAIACGKKTAPIPPEAVIPAPISDLAYSLDEKGVTLTWSIPTRTELGTQLPEIDEFIIEKAEYREKDYCRDCPIQYAQTIRIAGTATRDRQNKTLTSRDENLRPGHRYFYRVKAGLGWRVVSLASGPVSFTWQIPMAPPLALRCQEEGGQISLEWQPPGENLNGEPVDEPLHYQIYRNMAGGSFQPLNMKVQETTFIDRQVTNGLVYQYKVRAVRLSGGSGAFSDTTQAVPRDVTPPPPPQGLTAVITPEGIRLIWEPVTAVDLGGYQIFRRNMGNGAKGDFEMIGRIEAPLATFVDHPPQNQGAWKYSVKAFDRATPPNVSRYSNEKPIERNQ